MYQSMVPLRTVRSHLLPQQLIVATLQLPDVEILDVEAVHVVPELQAVLVAGGVVEQLADESGVVVWQQRAGALHEDVVSWGGGQIIYSQKMMCETDQRGIR